MLFVHYAYDFSSLFVNIFVTVISN